MTIPAMRSLLSSVLSSNRSIHSKASKSPGQLVLVFLEQQTKDNRVAQALAKRICKELNEVHLNAQETDKIIDSPQVPHTVKITDRTLFDGIILLQHYRPKIDEEVHVSQLRERLMMARKL